MLDAGKLDRVARRGAEVTQAAAEYRELDQRRRQLQGGLDTARGERNQANKEMAQVKDKKSEAFARARDRMRELSQRIKDDEAELARLEDECRERLLRIPNAPHESVPDGRGEADNRVESSWGERPSFSFAPKDHVDLGVGLGIMDFERSAKISGARFVVLRGQGAKLERALMAFMLDQHVARGYTEVWPPVLVRRHAMEGTGQLPNLEGDSFRTAAIGDDEGYYLAPTAEVPVTNLHRDEILEAAELPIRYAAYTACFRAEAGSYGKDTRGMLRQHQFDKVELVKFARPEDSYAELDRLRADAEHILRELELHYRVVTLCTADLGFSAAKTYDLEVWLPGQDAYREISSCSNYEDFQARRAKIRYRPAPGEKPELLHTLNGSALAIGRTLIALLEQHQREDGTVDIPAALRPYTGFARLGA